MRFTTLISSYLLTDTFRRWREQISSPASRFLVGAMMSLAGFVVIGMLNSAEDRIIYELEQMGSNRSQITATVSPTKPVRDLSFLDEFGEVFSYSVLPVQAQSEARTTLKVVGMREIDFLRLAHRFPEIAPSKPLVVDRKFRNSEFSNLTVQFKGRTMEAELVSSAPDALYSMLPDSIILSTQSVPQFKNLTHQRVFIVDSDESDRVGEAFKDWVQLENLKPGDFSYTDSSMLRAKLDQFQENKRWALTGLSLAVGSLVVAVFAACSILEFKQSVFVVTLMRSFGVPSRWLFLQRLLENVLLLLLSFGAGLGIALLLAASDLPIHYWLLYNDRGVASMLILAASGLIAAFVATCPVLLALKTEPGRLLK